MAVRFLEICESAKEVALHKYANTAVGVIAGTNSVMLYGDYTKTLSCVHTISTLDVFIQWPLLLTWFNFNPSMDK